MLAPMPTEPERGLGHIEDPVDDRDEAHSFEKLGLLGASAPVSANEMDEHFVPQDQLRTNSCTGQGAKQAIRIWQSENLGEVSIDPSALGLYANGQSYHPGLMGNDIGGHIRSVFRGANEFGLIPEELFPFEQEKATERPTFSAQLKAYKARKCRYRRHFSSGDRRLDNMRVSIANRSPIVFGLPVHRSFMPGRGPGYITKPLGDDPLVGWHCMETHGYKFDEGQLWFRVGNSWGLWRDEGKAWISASYILDAVDIWSVELVSS